MRNLQILQQAAPDKKLATFIHKNADSVWNTARDAPLAEREMRRPKSAGLDAFGCRGRDLRIMMVVVTTMFRMN
jgi:hypothetical protein